MEEEVHPNGEDSLSEDDDIAFLAPLRIMAERMGSTSTMFCQQNAMKSALPSSDDATRSSNATASAASPTIKSEVGLATSTECMELEALFALPRDVVEQRDPAPLPVCASLLRRYFRLSSGEFRPRQQEVCLSVLQGRRTLALCPTGWGKSVCYQFPMLVHRLLLEARCAEWRRIHAANEARALPTTADFTSKFCVVVSPLLSLMADQSEKVSTIDCLHAVVLSSQTSADRQADILRQLSCPLTAIDVVFISPERFVGDVAVRSTMEKQVHRIAFVCIDEVHCVSRWAFDFRPSFMYLHRVLVGVSFLCLTATATERVVADLQSIFCIDHTVVCIDQLRRNLHLESIDMVARSATFMGRGGPPAQRVLHDAVVSSAKELQKPMIIYVSSRADADEITSLLLTKMGSTSDTQPQQQTSSSTSATDVGKGETYSGCFTTASAKALLSSASTSPRPSHKVKVGCYHAGLLRSTRSHTQQQFLRGQLDILVATVAFGMGVDKSNIRSVLHANAPSSLEGYVQEIGRAGRDGGNSVCRLLFNPYDYFALRSRALSALLSPDELYEVVHAILSSPRTKVGMPMMLVSTANIATELVLSEEAVETVIFMLLTGVEATTTPLDALWGSVALGMRVSAPSTATPQADARPAKKRRRLAQDQGSGMHSVLEQLCVVDEVKEYCLRQTTIQNQVEAANALRLSWTDFRERVDDLQQSGALHVSRRGSAYLISLRRHVDVRSERLQRELSATLASTYMERIQNQVEALGRMFGVLAHPSHERLQSTLNGEALPSEWVPPPRALTKMEAVAMANDFVEKNRVRIHSTYEVARALLGVMPKSLIKHGKYAGELPLSHRWYVSDPMFGSLREFPLEWVLAILAPHKLDSQPESSS